jgi:hypothetical protein
MDGQNPISIKPKAVDHTVSVKTNAHLPSEREIKVPVEAESAPVEAPKQEPEQEAAPKPDERLEALERREKALYKRAQELKAQEERLKAPPEDGNKLTADEWRERFLEDPTALGIGYEDMAQRYLDQPSPEQQTIIELRREIEELRGGFGSLQDELKQREAQSYENAKKHISAEVERLVESNDDYAVIKAASAQEAVTQYIEQVYQEEGILLSTADAVSDVKEQIIEQHKAIASLLQPKAPQAPEGQETPQQGQTPKTLTHSMVQQSTRPLTARERAILVAQGRKNEIPGYQKG